MNFFLLLSASFLQPAAPSPDLVIEALIEGRVGERYDGYLAFRTAPDEATRRAVGAINIRRRALYSDLGERRSVAPHEVGITAGCRLLARVRPGGWYQLPDLEWRRRGADEAAPQPAYCTAAGSAN